MSDEVVLPLYVKYPGDRIDVDLRVISDDADTVASVDAVTVSPSGELDADDVDISGATAKVWLVGGVDEAEYVVDAPIHTALGRIIHGRFIVKVKA